MLFAFGLLLVTVYNSPSFVSIYTLAAVVGVQLIMSTNRITLLLAICACQVFGKGKNYNFKLSIILQQVFTLTRNN